MKRDDMKRALSLTAHRRIITSDEPEIDACPGLAPPGMSQNKWDSYVIDAIR
jgi:hypothetical protein